jgi:hypothetical protein
MKSLACLAHRQTYRVAIDCFQERQFDYIVKKMDQGLENIARIKRGEKPVYGEPDSQSKGTSTATSTPSPNAKLKPNANGSLDYHP